MFGLQEPRSSCTTEASEIHHLQRTLFWLHTDVGFAFVLGLLLQSQALLLSWRNGGWCFHGKVCQGLHKPTSIYLKLRQQYHVWTAIIFESEATFHIARRMLAFCFFCHLDVWSARTKIQLHHRGFWDPSLAENAVLIAYGCRLCFCARSAFAVTSTTTVMKKWWLMLPWESLPRIT